MISKVVSLVVLVHIAHCAKILGFFPTPSISHQFAFQPIWRELALRGHEVTVISPNILGENITTLKEIDIGHSYDYFRKIDISKSFGKDKNPFVMMAEMTKMFIPMMEEQFENPEVAKLIKSNDTQFDLILVEGLNPLYYAFGAKYRVPIVGICSLSAALNGQDAVGNPSHPVITPEMFFDFTPEEATLWNRIESFAFNVYYRFMYHFYWLPDQDKILRKYFGDDVPYLGDVERNISLMLVNVNPLMHTVRPNVPAVIEISQLHIKKSKKPLPDDLQTYLGNAKEGFVYFSLGSNVISANLDVQLRQAILEALGELPYKVLWKWETDHLPGQPKNVKIAKWLPQQSVLSHPNIKAFVTQGGIQSIEEALTNGVPMVGIPFLGDQPSNVRKLVKLGVAKKLDFVTLNKELLKENIVEIAGNKKYKERAAELGSLLIDVPMKGLDKAIWWIEYVLRHNGATHLVSPSRDMPYWKYYCLDVIGFIVVAAIVSLYILYNVVKRILLFVNLKNSLKTKLE